MHTVRANGCTGVAWRTQAGVETPSSMHSVASPLTHRHGIMMAAP